MLLLALKSLFFVAAILAYSTGVWRLINDYFRQEFRTYLDAEVKKNKYLVVDPEGGPSEVVPSLPPPGTIISEGEVRKSQGSVTANRLLDEMILSFGRVFTAGNKASGKRISAKPPTNEIITSTSTATPASSQTVSGEAGSSLGSKDPTRGTVIESDKFTRSSSEQGNNNLERSDGRNDDDDDDANDVGDDEEENWIKYWKNRESLSVGGSDGIGEGHCGTEVVAVCGP